MDPWQKVFSEAELFYSIENNLFMILFLIVALFVNS